MKEFKNLKLGMKIFFISLGIIMVSIIILGTCLQVFVSGCDYALVICLICTMLLLPASVLFYNHVIFDKKRIKLVRNTFDSLDHDKLVYFRKAEVGYEALEVLHMENDANEFYISSVVRGMYHSVKVESFSLEYTSDGKRKNEVLSRFYIFEFANKIDGNYNATSFSSKLLKESDKEKCKVVDNKLYLMYSNPKTKYYYQIEPLAFKNYDDFKKRIEEELDLIKNVTETVTK